MDIISGVGHQRSDSVELLVMKDSVQYPWHMCCIIGRLGQHNPDRNGLKS
jgi:hypothetical protein